MSETEKKPFASWAILELMGHRRLGGYVTDESMFGTAMCRIDVPSEDGTVATQFYGGASIYCLTPCTGETARAVARDCRPEPVTEWDARRRSGAPPVDGATVHRCDDDDFEPDGDFEDDGLPL